MGQQGQAMTTTQTIPNADLQIEAIEPNPFMKIFLDDKMKEREVLIMRLRAVEDTLLQHGRLKRTSLDNRRIR